MSRPRLGQNSKLARWQTGTRIAAFVFDNAILGTYLYTNWAGRAFDIPAYIALIIAYIVDIEEIVTLTNRKRTLRRLKTFWIIFLDFIAIAWFVVGLIGLTRWKTWDQPGDNLSPEAYDTVAAYEERHVFYLTVFNPTMIACMTGFSIRSLFILFYGIAWLKTRSQRKREQRQMEVRPNAALNPPSGEKPVYV